MLTKNQELTYAKSITKFGLSTLEFLDIDNDIADQYNKIIEEKHLDYGSIQSVPDQSWFVPNDIMNLDIEEHLFSLCSSQAEIDRVSREIELYKKHNMINVLRCVKHIVDTLKENNIVWGVGRGSSVASYCLFLLDLHKINSIKYNLPIGEFFKGEI